MLQNALVEYGDGIEKIDLLATLIFLVLVIRNW